MTIRQAIPILFFAVAATMVWGQMTVLQSNTAPTNNVVISQASGENNSPWRMQSGLRAVGQTFPGGFVLDKITIKMNTLSASGLEGDSFTMYIYTHANATTPTFTSTVATVTGNLPAALKSDFDGGKVYLTFDLLTNLTLSAGQQYSFYLDPAGFSTGSEFLVASQASSDFTDGIGLQQSGPAELTVWTGVQTPADLEFYLQEAPPIDTTKPSMAGKIPVDNATNQMWSINLVAMFDEAVQAGTGNITLKKTAGDVLVESFDVTSSARLTWDPAQVTIDPTNPLEGGVEYYVLIDATAVKDVAGNFFDGISSTTAWSFTTDDTPPAIHTLSPTNGAVNALPWANLVATFSETIVAGTGNVVITNLTDGTAMTIPVGDAQVTINGATLTINPSNDLSQAKHYAVLIDAGAVKDTSGQAFAGISTPAAWSLTIPNLVTLPVVNPSAETGDTTGWTAVSAGAHTGGVSDGDGYGWWVVGSLMQSLPSTFEPGTYALSVDVIDRFGYNVGWNFGLFYDDGGLHALVNVYGGPQNNGSYLQQDAVVTVNPGDPAVGKNIVIVLYSALGTTAWYDNVRLWGPEPPLQGTLILVY